MADHLKSEHHSKTGQGQPFESRTCPDFGSPLYSTESIIWITGWVCYSDPHSSLLFRSPLYFLKLAGKADTKMTVIWSIDPHFFAANTWSKFVKTSCNAKNPTIERNAPKVERTGLWPEVRTLLVSRRSKMERKNWLGSTLLHPKTNLKRWVLWCYLNLGA